MKKITFLGTGHGMPNQSSTSSMFVNESDTSLLLDVGGGHEILKNLKSANIDTLKIQNIFISHTDSDHILGIVPLIRLFSKNPEVKRDIYCSENVKNAIESLFSIVSKSYYEKTKPALNYILLDDGMEIKINDWTLNFFDVKSTKTLQFGCKIRFEDNTTLAFLGDEPLNDNFRESVVGTDTVIHEAFCLDGDKEIFQPHEKHHGTVKEAAQNATSIDAKNLIFFHMEDKTLNTRKEQYSAEAKKYFSGNVFVPIDGDVFEF